MKKTNLLFLGLAGLALASCSQEDITAPGAGEGYTITVNLPADLATRAPIGETVTAAQVLNYAVFDANNGDALVESKALAFPTGATSMSVPLSFVKGGSYKVAFFSQSESSLGTYKDDYEPGENAVYSFDSDTGTVTVNYDNMNGEDNVADAYDCFYKLYTVENVPGAISETIYLTRPVAQINWGTNDLGSNAVKTAFGADGENIQTEFTMTAFNTLDIVKGTVSNDVTVDLAKFILPSEETTFPAGTTFPVTGYEYVAMQYVLAPLTESGTYDLDLTVTNKTEVTPVNEVAIPVDNAPLRANYRTNIYGALLTDAANLTVKLDPDWGTPAYQNVYDYDALKYALQNTTNGTVYLQKDIVFPASLYVLKDVELNLNGHNITYNGPSTSGTFTVQGSSTNFTISGEGTITNETGSPIVWVANSGTVNIKGGSFNSYGHCVYLGGRNNGGGIANISGGSFKTVPADNWALNIYDTDRATSEFNVTGGMFYDFNPANNVAEGTDTNFVNDEYQSVETTIDGETWYVVVPKGDNVTVANSSDAVAEAINNATTEVTIYLTPGIVQLPNTVSGKNITIKGLDPNNSGIDAQNAYWYYSNCSISFEDVTLYSFYNPTNHTSMGFMEAEEQTFTNVTFEGEFHIFSGNATFTDCTFNYEQLSGTNYQLWCQTSGTVNVNNCTMNCNNGKAFLVWGTEPGAIGGDINIDGLTVTSIGAPKDNGVVEIHSENYSKAGTINIDKVTYPSSIFTEGLWHEVNNGTGAATHFYTVIVNGETVQEGDQVAN